ARKVSQQVLEQAAYITPNEHEAALMFDGLTIEEALRQFPNKLLITEGKNGVRYFDGSREVLVPGYPVKAVDTTGAGDTFNGALAVALI
ncbi:PfkB family carbohydrate kinase, partial [Planococcus sp. SIMBA_160]